MMPVMDGIPSKGASRNEHTFADFNDYGKVTAELLEEAFTLGVDDYMVKPIRLEAVGFACSSIAEKSASWKPESPCFTYDRDDTVYQIRKRVLRAL